jgi:micrococcal nuclease
MKQSLNSKIVFLAFIFFLLLLAVPVFAEKVAYVIDGDTIIVDNHERVRLIGINAPEINSKYHRGEFFGKESRKYLKDRLEGKEVVLKAGTEPFDKYGRRLSYVYLPDGAYINEEMVRLGYAETFRAFPFPDKEKFLSLEEAARDKQLGMWGVRKKPWWLKSLWKKKS